MLLAASETVLLKIVVLQAAAGSNTNNSATLSTSVPAASSAQQTEQLSTAGDAMLAAQLQNEDQACTIISDANKLVCRSLMHNFTPHRVADKLSCQPAACCLKTVGASWQS